MVLALVNIIGAAISFFEALFFAVAMGGGPAVGDVQYVIIDTSSVVMLIVSIACSICTVVAFAMWLHRAAGNLQALGAHELRFTPGWAVAWLFIPLANLVMPLLVLVEIWRASDPDVGASDRVSRAKLPSHFVIPLWWGICLLLLVVIFASVPFSIAQTDREKFVLFASEGLLDVVIAAWFGLTLLVVRLVETRQARKHALLIGAAP